jgi:hypothetical protein
MIHANRPLTGALLLVAASCLGACADKGGGRHRDEPPPPPPPHGALTLHGCTQWDTGKLSCAASVTDANGALVAGLSQPSFTVTEAVAGGAPQPATFGEPEYQFDGPGFWERTVTSEKVDLVFVIDHSGTMEEEMPGIRAELHAVVNGLVARRADFRVGVLVTHNILADYHVEPMRGPMEQVELHAGIDAITEESGEWWVPSAMYDGMLLAVDNPADGLSLRPNARKLVVVITDSISQSVYGAIWYSGWTTTATLAAVNRLQELYGLEILSSTPRLRRGRGDRPEQRGLCRP